MLIDRPAALPVGGVRQSLWRAAVVFRAVALAVALFLIVQWQPLYDRGSVALAAGAGMVLVTAALGWPAWRGAAHRLPLVAADLVATAALTLLTPLAQTGAQEHGGMVTLTTIWGAGPTLGAAIVAGPVGGALAALVQYAVTVTISQDWQGRTLYSGVLLLVTGVVVGYVGRLAVRAEDDLRTASAAQAALAERERLARSIHDGVLQVLGLVHRTGRDAGGPWAPLAAAAGEQEAALRGLITSGAAPATPAGRRDIGETLRALRRQDVTVSTPAETVDLDAAAAAELAAAVSAALDNVRVHAGDGAHAWVLLETLDDELRVTVRDDGTGFADGRLAAAEREGRIGVARSVRGRVAELGGRCTVTSAPGQGTEIELVVPLSAAVSR